MAKMTKEAVLTRMKERVSRLCILSECAEAIVNEYASARGDNEPVGPDDDLLRACRAPGTIAEIYPYEIELNGTIDDVWRGKLTFLAEQLMKLLIDRDAGQVDDREPALVTMPGLYGIAWKMKEECEAIEELVYRLEALNEA